MHTNMGHQDQHKPMNLSNDWAILIEEERRITLQYNALLLRCLLLVLFLSEPNIWLIDICTETAFIEWFGVLYPSSRGGVIALIPHSPSSSCVEHVYIDTKHVCLS
jgi:hypothetical protein